MISFDDNEYARAVQIVQDPDTGTLHIFWAEDAPSVRELHYGCSMDAGQTWSSEAGDNVISFPDGNAFYEECSAVSGGGGVEVVVWSEVHAGTREVHYGASLDDGLTWSSQAADLLLSDPTSAVDTGVPSITCDWNGVFHVVWHQTTPGGVAEVHYGRSADDGATWTSQAADRVISFPDGNAAITPRIVACEDRLYAFWREDDAAGDPRIHVGISQDGGDTWSSELADREISPATNIMTDLSASAYWYGMGPGVHVVYRASYNTASPYYYEIYSSSSFDAGATWTGETTLTRVSHDEGAGRSASNPDVIVGASLGAMAVWDEVDDIGGTNEQHVSFLHDVTWTGAAADSVISFPDGENGYRPAAAVTEWMVVPKDGYRMQAAWVVWTEFAGGTSDNYEVHVSILDVPQDVADGTDRHWTDAARAFPSPSPSASNIRFSLPQAAEVRVEIFDAEGRRVRGISEYRGAGEAAIVWDGRDDAGRMVLPGRYQARITAGDVARSLSLVRL